MKKFEKIVAMCLAVVMSITALSVSVSANEDAIDYSVYDPDMVYIVEDAMRTDEYNATLKSRSARGSTPVWDWDNGIYSETCGASSGFGLEYAFVPVNNYLYFNVEVGGVSAAPHMAVNKLNSDGSLTYVGSYYLNSLGNNTYGWTNYKRTLTSGQQYTFSFWYTDSTWTYAYVDVYKSAM